MSKYKHMSENLKNNALTHLDKLLKLAVNSPTAEFHIRSLIAMIPIVEHNLSQHLTPPSSSDTFQSLFKSKGRELLKLKKELKKLRSDNKKRIDHINKEIYFLKRSKLNTQLRMQEINEEFAMFTKLMKEQEKFSNQYTQS